MHILPQSGSSSTDCGASDATILLCLSSIIIAMVGIAEHYVTYTMYGLMGNFWERQIWTHGAKVACLAISSGCLTYVFYQRCHKQPKLFLKRPLYML